MLQQYVPHFGERIDSITEAYNAKLPEEMNAYCAIDKYLKGRGFKCRAMPTSKPSERRLVYWRGNKRICVVVYYAGGDIRIEVPSNRLEVMVSHDILDDFIRDHLSQYVE